MCLASKSVRHKPYNNLQSLSVLTYQLKDLSMNFVTGLLVLTNWKSKTYNSILVIVNRLIKIAIFKLVKVTIDTPSLVEIIIKVVVWHHSLMDSIISDQSSVFTSKF